MKQNIAKIKSIFAHFVGNRTTDDRLILNQRNELRITDEQKDILRDHFLLPFTDLENFQKFSHDVNLDLNEVYSLVRTLFNGEKDLLELSHDLAKLLLKRSVHPNIKTGDLQLIQFDDLLYEDQIINGLGIFKTEEKKHFIRSEFEKGTSSIDVQTGIPKSQVDKACLIFNTEELDGFRILLIDKTNKGKQAQFWYDTFLELSPVNNDYSLTEEYLSMCNSFVKEELTETDRTTKIDVVNKSLNYFKENDSFSKESFVKSVFSESGKEYAEKFEQFEQVYTNNEPNLSFETFEISQKAVKKKSRIFKRVLKLDSNFHIYIHGDKNLIEKGFDKSSGRKFYKIYFEEEN